MSHMTPTLEAALRTLFEELPKVASTATCVDIAAHIDPRQAEPFWAVSVLRNGLLYASGSVQKPFPRTADELVADIEAGLEALHGPKRTPAEIAEAEFGPFFGGARV